MVRVLVVGHAPLPIENASRNYAPGSRTWQFVAPLLAVGHEVCLIAFRLPNAYPTHQPDQYTNPQDNFHYQMETSLLKEDKLPVWEQLLSYRYKIIATKGMDDKFYLYAFPCSLHHTFIVERHENLPLQLTTNHQKPLIPLLFSD